MKKINSNFLLFGSFAFPVQKSWLSIIPRPDPVEEGREHHLTSGLHVIRHSKKSLVLCIVGLLLDQCLGNVF